MFAKKKKTKLFGAGTLDHKEARKETEAASGGEKVLKVWIVLSLNTCSARDEHCVHLFHTPRTARRFLQPCSSKESNLNIIISSPGKTHVRSRSDPFTRYGLPRLRSDRRKSTHAKTRTSADGIELDSIAIEMLVQTGLKQANGERSWDSPNSPGRKVVRWKPDRWRRHCGHVTVIYIFCTRIKGALSYGIRYRN